MNDISPLVWRSPEELIAIGFERSRVVMMNEAHNGLLRCIRTREIGRRVLPVVHEIGARHLAMEALYPYTFAKEANQTKQVPPLEYGYLSQPEMRLFIQAALDLGWTLIPYEVDYQKWIAGRTESSPDESQLKSLLMSIEYTNWREEEQARNLIGALEGLPRDTNLLIWCGNGHHSKVILRNWIPMGYHFRRLSNIDPFVINQIVTVNFDLPNYWYEKLPALEQELEAFGGTAGFLRDEAPSPLRSQEGEDAFLFSLYNQME